MKRPFVAVTSAAVVLAAACARTAFDSIPKEQAPGSGAIAIAGSEGVKCAIARDATLWCWGNFGETTTIVPTPRDGTWTSVSAGGCDTCAVTTEGALVCWSACSSALSFSSPRSDYGAGRKWSKVAVGSAEFDGSGLPAYAIGTDGTLWTWTGSSWTQVGVDTDWVEISAAYSSGCGLRGDGSIWCNGSPGLRRVGEGRSWTHIAVDYGGLCAFASDKSLWCWRIDGGVPSPVASPAGLGWAGIFAARGGLCSVATDGSLWCADDASGEHLSRLTGPSGVVAIAGGSEVSCAIDGDAAVWCWGRSWDEIGRSADASAGSFSPATVSGPLGQP